VIFQNSLKGESIFWGRGCIRILERANTEGMICIPESGIPDFIRVSGADIQIDSARKVIVLGVKSIRER
jgi:hypothetical protein